MSGLAPDAFVRETVTFHDRLSLDFWKGYRVGYVDAVMDEDRGERGLAWQMEMPWWQAPTRRVRRIIVDVPENVDNFDALFTAVGDALYDWEPNERDGWDVNVSSRVVEEIADLPVEETP